MPEKGSRPIERTKVPVPAMSPTPRGSVLSAERLRAIDVHAALDRSQHARRTLNLADVELHAATVAFDLGLDEHVGSSQLRLLDADVEVATAAQAVAAWSNAESEIALIGVAGRPLDDRHGRGVRHHGASFPAEPQTVSQVRELLRSQLAGVVEPDLLGDIELMASEVTTNCIQHEKPAVVAVEVDIAQVSNRQTTITVTVSGGHADLAPALLRPPGAPSSDAGSGRGLGILDSLAHVWGTQRRHLRTSVWFSVTTATAPTPRPDLDVVEHLQRAAAVLADAAAIADEAEAQVLLEFEDAARLAAEVAQTAVVTAAVAAARAVDTARRSRAAAAGTAAAAVARVAASSARAVAERACDPQPGLATSAACDDAVAAAVVADAVVAAATTARDLTSRAARTDARLAALAASRVLRVAEGAAEGAALVAAAGLGRIREAAAARRAVFETPLLAAASDGPSDLRTTGPTRPTRPS